MKGERHARERTAVRWCSCNVGTRCHTAGRYGTISVHRPIVNRDIINVPRRQHLKIDRVEPIETGTKRMELTISTLTPLWTGGVEPGKVDRIHETGILGSLRWWYEAIVRGLGGKACDPSKGECRFDAEKYQKSTATDERQRLRDAGLCDVCQLFGATGWRRRFRLAVVADKTQPDVSIDEKIQADRTYTRNNKQHTPTWYFPGNQNDKPRSGTLTLHIQSLTWYFPGNQNDKPRSGTLTLHIQSLAPGFQPEIIAGLVQFIADWAAIGARAQMGFGVIKLEQRINTTQFYNWVIAVAGTEAYPRLPSLKNIFLARISPKNGKTFSDQDTFNLKYDLRRLFADDLRLPDRCAQATDCAKGLQHGLWRD